MRSSTTDTILEAQELIALMDSIEPSLSEFELRAAEEQQTQQRLDDLMLLNRYYLKRVGVAFENRQEFRRQLVEVTHEKTRSISEAREIARSEYDRVYGTGLPRLTCLVSTGYYRQGINEILTTGYHHRQ